MSTYWFPRSASGTWSWRSPRTRKTHAIPYYTMVYPQQILNMLIMLQTYSAILYPQRVGNVKSALTAHTKDVGRWSPVEQSLWRFTVIVTITITTNSTNYSYYYYYICVLLLLLLYAYYYYYYKSFWFNYCCQSWALLEPRFSREGCFLVFHGFHRFSQC